MSALDTNHDRCIDCGAILAEGLRCAVCLAQLRACASAGCYACKGSGVFLDGSPCVCVAQCEECGEPFPWERDDERAPKACPKCDGALSTMSPNDLEADRRACAADAEHDRRCEERSWS